jgi:hypothetical protein
VPDNTLPLDTQALPEQKMARKRRRFGGKIQIHLQARFCVSLAIDTRRCSGEASAQSSGVRWFSKLVSPAALSPIGVSAHFGGPPTPEAKHRGTSRRQKSGPVALSHDTNDFVCGT